MGAPYHRDRIRHDMQEYYNLRAAEYEEKYHRAEPARQREQEAIAGALRELFAGRTVLEVACGTGYWTEVAAGVAQRVVGVDGSKEMLAIARAKPFAEGKVELVLGDAYALVEVPGTFTGGLANFWLSHVPRSRMAEFLAGFHAKLEAGAAVFMADDVYIPGVGGELVTPEGAEDTYKRRTLADGTSHLIIKNYYSKADLRELFTPFAADLRIHVGECHWWVAYTLLQSRGVL